MLSEQIKKLRKQKNMTQEELAQNLHVVRQTVSKWEQGTSVPDIKTAIQLAEILGRSVEELTGEPPACKKKKFGQKLFQNGATLFFLFITAADTLFEFFYPKGNRQFADPYWSFFLYLGIRSLYFVPALFLPQRQGASAGDNAKLHGVLCIGMLLMGSCEAATIAGGLAGDVLVRLLYFLLALLISFPALVLLRQRIYPEADLFLHGMGILSHVSFFEVTLHRLSSGLSAFYALWAASMGIYAFSLFLTLFYRIIQKKREKRAA